MIPVQRAAVAHFEVIVVGLARRNRIKPIAVVSRVDGQPVPMHDRRCVDAVGERCAHALPAAQDERGIEVIAPAMAHPEGERAMDHACRQATGLRGDERERLAGQREAAEVTGVPRNVQRPRIALRAAQVARGPTPMRGLLRRCGTRECRKPQYGRSGKRANEDPTLHRGLADSFMADRGRRGLTGSRPPTADHPPESRPPCGWSRCRSRPPRSTGRTRRTASRRRASAPCSTGGVRPESSP